MTNRGTIQGQEAFLGNIASRLGRKEPLKTAPERPFRGVPDFYRNIKRTEDEMIELFTDHWTALTGKVLITDEAKAGEQVAEFILNGLRDHQADKVARWEHEQLRKLGLDEALGSQGIQVVPWIAADAIASEGTAGERSGDSSDESLWSGRAKLLRETERCNAGIVWPDFAIANTGTLLLKAAADRGRSVSLLPDMLFAIFYADQLVSRMGEALASVSEEQQLHGTIATSINMITGPSRSADIENDLTIGIHGPGKVYAAIIKRG
jgi:L-lactate dehydrogenase complex protein LldG